MLRVEVSEAGHDALPAVDVDDTVVVIGSGPGARIRLPAAAARDQHVMVEGRRWRALGEVKVDGVVQTGGELGDGVVLELGGYRVRLAVAPAGAIAAPVQRTESLARELMRGLLGTGAAPTLEIERGPSPGATRALAPPESTLVIGRGDEAGWPVLDEDLSRAHAEVRRGWDGVRIVDLGSKNKTKVDGVIVGADGAALRDGAVIELGKVVMRFRDPAEAHLRGESRASTVVARPRPPAAAPAPVAAPASTLPFYAALAIAMVALAGLAWLIAS